MDWHVYIWLSLLLILFFEVPLSYSSTQSNLTGESGTRVLSRRKRYLVFPDGSSLQLVFCNQITAIIPIGDIFLFGDTLSLAWNLPTDPELFYMFKTHEKAERRQDLNEIYYLDEVGRVIAKVPYKRKQFINPAFAKRSIDDQNMSFKEKLRLKLDKNKMHEKQKSRDYLKEEHMNEKSVNFHRSSRIGLYEKLEALFTSLGQDGHACVLYKLCEAKRPTQQGTFLQELTRVVFTLPKGTTFEKEDHRDYDKAHHHSNDDCSLLYPGCENLAFSDKIL